jgi:hypothetical protein
MDRNMNTMGKNIKRESMRHWNEKQIIETLNELHSAGENIRPGTLHKTHHGLLAAGTRIFGNSRHMYIAAGFDPDELGMPRIWTDEAVIEAIQERFESGKDLSQAAVRKEDMGLSLAASRRFGGWYKALEAANIDPNVHRRQKESGYWTREVILDQINALNDENKPIYARYALKNYGALFTAAWKEFGTWENAITAAGLDYEDVRMAKSWTNEDILLEIQDTKRKGLPLTSLKVKKENGRLWDAARYAYGDWYSAVEAAGIPKSDITKSDKWTRFRVLRRIQSLILDGQSPEVINQSDNLGFYDAACKFYGSWEKAYRVANLTLLDSNRNNDKSWKRKRWSGSEIKDELKRYIDRYGSLDFLGKNDLPLYMAVRNHFGNLRNATRSFGFDYDQLVTREKWSKKRIIEKIRNSYDSGEDLSLNSFRKAHKALFEAACSKKYFGNWENAIEEAGLDYDRIRSDWYLETLRGRVFEDYVFEVLKSIGWNIERHRIFRYDDEICIPDFYDKNNGIWIDAKLNSYGEGVEDTIQKYLSHSKKIMIIHLEGRSRGFGGESIEFVPIKRLFPQIRSSKMSSLIEDIELLRKGVLKPEQQKRLIQFILEENRENMEDAEEMISVIQTRLRI